MNYYVEVPVPAGAPVLVEVTSQIEGVVPAGRRQEVIAQAAETFDEAFDRFQAMARGAVERARAVGGPDRIAVEFGVKIAAKGRFVVAETTGEAHVKVVFEWNREPRPERPAGPADEPSGDDADG